MKGITRRFTAVSGCLLSLLVASAFSDEALEQISADPDVIGSGIEFCRTLQVKAGDRFTIGRFDIGGFIEARNEQRFHQGLLPNHNWRGVLGGFYSYPLVRQMQLALYLFTGFEHESAHATMGIVEPTGDPHGMIYDHQYRKSILNALPLGAELVMYDQLHRLVLRGSGNLYFHSKNTPELSGPETGNGGGLTVGGVYRYLFGGRVSCFASLHDRLIFRGAARASDGIWVFEDTTLVITKHAYPVINQVNTVSVQGGISLPLFQSRRLLDVYFRYLYGHVYGYVDSREIRSIVAVGVAIRGW